MRALIKARLSAPESKPVAKIFLGKSAAILVCNKDCFACWAGGNSSHQAFRDLYRYGYACFWRLHCEDIAVHVLPTSNHDI